MNRAYISSYFSFLFAIGCVILKVQGYNAIAPVLGLAAFALAFYGGILVTANWQLYSMVIIATIFGYSLSPAGSYYLMTLSLFCITMTSVPRSVAFESLGYTGAAWIEPLFYIMSVGLYISANLKEGIGWESWVLPLGALGFPSFRMVGAIIEGKDFSTYTKYIFANKLGSKAPDFTLTDHDGNKVSLSDYQGRKHVLVIFVRGDWCPTCHIMLRTYERYKNKFAEKNITLLAIGPDPVGVNKDMVERLGVDYKILSDDKNEAARAYGMMFQNNNPMTKYKEGIPLPASFLVDINGTLAYTSNTKKPGEILRPETIFPVVEKLRVA